MPVQTNQFTPLGVTVLSNPTTTPDAVTETQYALERLTALTSGPANPPFALTSQRNRLVENGGTISRGYIRRTNTDTADPTSGYRLYFMYNPETIQRSYVAYLDQQTLDPNNALFGSNNMTAPPGIVDFTFELLFDRHIEVASDPLNPGTKVDYDFFDLVVRGVVPDTAATGNAIPDNGVMMVNPHSITVVFGEDLSVQGRVTNASVNFQKFNNRMIPTRLRIIISMKALYIGPVQTVPNYSLYSSEQDYSATIPYEDSTVTVTYESIVLTDLTGLFKGDSPGSEYTNPSVGPGANAGNNWLQFANAVLKNLSAPVSRPNQEAMLLWMVYENRPDGLVAANNPMNIQTGNYAHIARTRGGQYIFSSPDEGAATTARFLLAGYDGVVAAFRAGNDARAVLSAIQDSPWAESHYNYQLVYLVPISDDRFNQLAAGVLTQSDPSNSVPG